MSKSQPSHVISGVFVFLLLGIFAVFSTVMVLLGARSYKATSERTQQHNEGRVAAAYVRSMLRADDRENVVRVENVSGVTAVTLSYDYEGEEYLTRLYAYDGMLRELFAASDVAFDPEMGESVCALEGLEAQMKDGLLSVRLKAAEAETDVEIALRCAAE